MSGFQLTAQNILGVKDENALIHLIEQELEHITSIFHLEYEYINGTFPKEKAEEFKDLRAEWLAEGVFNDGEDIMRCTEDVQAVISSRIQSLRVCLNELASAEQTIESAYYKGLKSDIAKTLPDIEASTFEELMRYDPALMARQINKLNRKFKIHFFHPSVIKQKCREFLALKEKAETLYEIAETEQKNFLSACITRALKMLVKVYCRVVQENIPSDILEQFINSITARKVKDAESFTPALHEPLNVTVGTVYFDFPVPNKAAKQFLDTNYSFIRHERGFMFPYTIAVNESLALFHTYSQDNSEKAKSDIQSLCMNIFLSSPPNKIRFYFIDPLKSGQTFAVFQHFEDSSTSGFNVVAGGIQTEPDSIEAQLQVLVDRIKTMQTSTFKGEYSNIREYNAKNIRNPQPYSILGIMDFPAGFNARSIELLSRVLATGRECGIYVIIMSGDSQQSQLMSNIAGMCRDFKLSGNFYASSKITGRYLVDDPLDVAEIVKLAPVMKKAIRDAGNAVIPYSEVAPSESEYLKSTTEEGLSIPIGINSANEIQSLTLGRPGSQAIHALICGQIGSGKSRLLHAIITGALLKYPEEELRIYLVDFKSGTEFKIYADYNLPSFRVIAIESEQEFGLSVLRSLKKESDRRAQIFNICTKSDITSYNSDSECTARYGRLPRVLVVIDEFHVLFGGDNNIASESSKLMDGLLRLDRSYGFHVVLCSQSIRGLSGISEAAFAQIAVRIALKCPKEDADIVLGKGSDAIAQIEENDAGSAIYVPAISSPKANKFRAALLTQEEHARRLGRLDEIYTAQHKKSDARILVSEVSDSRNSVFQEYFADDSLSVQDRVIHIGEALRVDAKLEVKFNAARDNNMLLLGKDLQKAQNILFFAALDLILQRVKQFREGRPQINLHVVNYCDGAELDMNDKLEYLGRSSGQVHYYNGENASAGIEEVYRRLMSREDDSPDEWLIVSNITLGEELSGKSMFMSQQRTSDMFNAILETGPEKGIFSIVWCDDPEVYRRKFANTFDYFSKRVIFNVSAREAEELADITGDDSINRNNAYIYQRGKGKEKFRPYSTPMDKWTAVLCGDKLSRETAGGAINNE